MNMARRQVLVQLTDELVAQLDERAGRLGQSRSELIRRALEREVRDERKRAIDRAIVEGYTRLPPDGEFDAWAEAAAIESIREEPW